jgi:GNAT superfamily N-acetyltransferase
MSESKSHVIQPLETTYLEMRAEPAPRGQKSPVSGQKFEVRELTKPNWEFNREMYFKVGENWKWIDKRKWTDEQWKEYASDPKVRTFAGYYGGDVAGYYELRRAAAAPSGDQESEISSQRSAVTGQIKTEETEIAYFGLLPEFIGRGLGGALLTSAIENAWEWAPTPARIWVHTCNRDHPSALANYQARGFKIYKVETLSG